MADRLSASSLFVPTDPAPDPGSVPTVGPGSGAVPGASRWTPTELWWGCNLQPAAIRAMARHPGGADLPLRPSAVDDQAITLGGGAFHSRDNPGELQVVQFHP